jgi:hypothetical protein
MRLPQPNRSRRRQLPSRHPADERRPAVRLADLHGDARAAPSARRRLRRSPRTRRAPPPQNRRRLRQPHPAAVAVAPKPHRPPRSGPLPRPRAAGSSLVPARCRRSTPSRAQATAHENRSSGNSVRSHGQARRPLLRLTRNQRLGARPAWETTRQQTGRSRSGEAATRPPAGRGQHMPRLEVDPHRQPPRPQPAAAVAPLP